MEYRKIGKENISLLGMGFMRPPRKDDGKIDTEQWQNIVNYAAENGINYFDTAYTYLNGLSEKHLGEFLENIPRHKYNIATKMPMYKNKSNSEMEKLFQTQLERLKVDYVDYYLFHAVKSSNWNNFKNSALYDFLYEKKKNGFVRYIGFSFHDKPELLEDIIGEYDWDFAQIQLNYMDWTFQNAKEQYNILDKQNLPIIVMEPLRGGGLVNLTEKSIAIFKEADPAANAASWGLRYAASFPNVLTVLSGMSSMEQVKDNIKTFETFKPINEDEQLVIDKALKTYLEVQTIPCTGCGYCLECPQNIDIPTFFSEYNFYQGKKTLNSNIGRKAETDFIMRYSVVSARRSINVCKNCGFCKKICPQHIDIPTELSKIKSYVEELKTQSSMAKHSHPEKSANYQNEIDFTKTNMNEYLWIKRQYKYTAPECQYKNRKKLRCIPNSIMQHYRIPELPSD